MKSKIIFFYQRKTDNQLFFGTAKGQILCTQSSHEMLVSQLTEKMDCEFHDAFTKNLKGTERALYLFECPEKTELITLEKDRRPLQWLNFPETIKALQDSKDRNVMQLVVQYLSQKDNLNAVDATEFNGLF